jgi:hypothetical protein
MGMLALLVMTGCPSEFGRGGRVDRAVHSDALELVRKYCPPEQYEKFCGGAKKDSQECRDQCGG